MLIKLTEIDIQRLEVIGVDQDKDDAYRFIKERILPEIKRQKGMKMKSHLDGGKGSAF